MNDQKIKFLKLFPSKACNIAETCKAVGISRQTYYNWLKADPEFKAEAHTLEEAIIDYAESCLIRSMQNGNVTAIIFFLTNKRPEAWKHQNQLLQKVDINFDGTVDLQRKFQDHAEAVLERLVGKV